MKNLNNQISGSQLQELSIVELNQISGGSWLGEVAGFVGYCVGFATHAVIDTVLLVNDSLSVHEEKK